MMDRSLPYVRLVMTKEDMQVYPRCPLPSGYRFETWHSGLEEDWCAVQCAAGHIETLERARDVFRETFLSEPEEAAKRCFYVFAPDGAPAAAAALWWGDLFGEPRACVHWVATAQSHQGKGLAKALMTRLMDCYRELGLEGGAYLTSQTWSYKALALYEQFGFRPWMGPRPAGWGESEEEFTAQQERGWRIVREQLAASAGPKEAKR